jgi:hypothetical protein
LLAHKFERFFVQFGAQISETKVRNLIINKNKMLFAPNRYFAEQVVVLFKLFHLSLPNTSVFALCEIVLHLMPSSDILAAQCDLRSVLDVTNGQMNSAGNTHWLRTRAATRVKSPNAAPLSPHIRMKKCVAREWTL